MNLIIGQYYPNKSIIHMIDPRLKIILVMTYFIAVFLSNTFVNYFISSIFLFLVIILTKIPLKLILSSLKTFIFIFLFTTIINIFLQQEGQVILDLYILKITTGGIIYSLKILIRLIILIISSNLFTLTTSPIEISNSLESLLNPLKKLNFPAHEISLMVSIALRFIPTFAEEFDKIKKAQMSRGVDFEDGNLIKRVKAFIPLLIPIFISAFKRADELAIAMEARCYRGDINRTRRVRFKLKKLDLIALLVFLIYFSLTIFIKLHL